MIYISTDYVFDGQGEMPWGADCKDYHPLNVYGHSKLEGELAVSSLLEKYFIIRIAWVFGVNGKNFVKTMLNLGKTRDKLTVVCDHPAHITGQPGSDFLKLVHTQWDEIKFIGGNPEEYIAMAKRSGDDWFIGVMNNSVKRNVLIDTSFLEEGNYVVTYWADGKNPTDVVKKTVTVKAGKPIKVNMNSAGGYVAVVRPE